MWPDWFIPSCIAISKRKWWRSSSGPWLIFTCDMTHSYVWHTHCDVWHDSFVCVTWLILTCDTAFHKCVTWSQHAATYRHFEKKKTEYYKHESFLITSVVSNQRLFFCFCDMIHSYVWHDSFICVNDQSFNTTLWCHSFNMTLSPPVRYIWILKKAGRDASTKWKFFAVFSECIHAYTLCVSLCSCIWIIS